MSLVAPLDSTFCLQLTAALGHFLWQGLVIAVAASAIARVLCRASARARYLVFVVAMLLMAACTPLTLAILRDSGVAPPAASRISARVAASNGTSLSSRLSDSPPPAGESGRQGPLRWITVLVMGRAWSWLWSSRNGEAVIPSAIRLYRLGSSKRIRDLALVTLQVATRTILTGSAAAWQCAEVALAWRPSSAVVFAPAVPSVRGGCLRDDRQWL